MRRHQRTLKCSTCGVDGHNKRACTYTSLQHPPEIPDALSQLSTEHVRQMPPKLQVRKNLGTSTEETTLDVGAQDDAPTIEMRAPITDPIAPMQSTSVAIRGLGAIEFPPTAKPATRPAPTMYQQLKQGQLHAPGVNIRCPAPFVGGIFIPSNERCITKPSTSSKSIITGGQKYVGIQEMTSTLIQQNAAKRKKK
ncbi:hypothetical protein DH2020_032239 [Rehmannia glutinosa]|uniref:CCHC-type domain-containing protein n=1 Tax=Rehmannia glutinosa TaxID=99300 RepID=A0ABR0VIN1_REHGL